MPVFSSANSISGPMKPISANSYSSAGARIAPLCYLAVIARFFIMFSQWL